MRSSLYSLLLTGVGLVVASPAFAQATTLTNPINTSDPNQLLANIIKTALGVVGAIALVFFIYGGFMMLISGGSSDRVKKGRDTLMWATIGLVFIFGSYGIVSAVFSALSGNAII